MNPRFPPIHGDPPVGSRVPHHRLIKGGGGGDPGPPVQQRPSGIFPDRLVAPNSPRHRGRIVDRVTRMRLQIGDR